MPIVFDEVEGVVEPSGARPASPPTSTPNPAIEGAQDVERTLRELRARTQRQARLRAD